MQHSRYPFAVKSVLFSVLAAALSGCSTLWNIDEDAPPPPPVREVRQLRVPADLSPVRPLPNPYTAAIAAAQAVPQPAAALIAPVPVEPVAAVPVVAEPVKAAAARASKEEGTLFAPYFPTESEKQAPQQWEMSPSYAFPWVTGAQPSRVNEETVLGAGDRMIGRFFANVSFEKNIPSPMDRTTAAPVTITKEPAPEPSLLSRLRSKLTGAAPAPVVKEEPAAPAQQFVQCEGATCLDAARDALVADAKVKGWEMLLNRRVSMHQSFQFRKNDRIVLIEVSSDGKKNLDIEYALLPTQINSAGN